MLLISNVQSQTFEGVYEEGFERFEFHADTVYYLIGTNGGLIYPVVGYGKYNILDSFLVIENLDSIKSFKIPVLNADYFYSDTNYLIYADQGYTIFKIDQISICNIKCTLLSYNYKLKTNTEKSLRKVLKKANRIPYCKGRERAYKRQEC